MSDFKRRRATRKPGRTGGTRSVDPIARRHRVAQHHEAVPPIMAHLAALQRAFTAFNNAPRRAPRGQ